MKSHFSVLVPAYNCVSWVQSNLGSIIRQKYDNYQLIYIDDASTDGTAAKAKELLQNSNIDYKLFENSFNKGKANNLHHYINSLRDDTIVVVVDGDDWLANDHVLNFLDSQYSDDTWMTCGSYITTDTKSIVHPTTTEDYWSGNIRNKSWQFSHLGTFRKKLFSKIKRKDFLDKSGNYFSTTSDQAMMWPMAEMAGPAHFKPLREALYVYNRSNPISDDRAHRRDQLQTEASIRSRKPYQRLENL
tara:strand:- start:23802 stop:24536 length:735 start_codon:yes stop_codon:yes gene_type:complete